MVCFLPNNLINQNCVYIVASAGSVKLPYNWGIKYTMTKIFFKKWFKFVISVFSFAHFISSCSVCRITKLLSLHQVYWWKWYFRSLPFNLLPYFFLSYKFTLDELYPMMAAVKLRAESYKEWLCAVQGILGKKENHKRGEIHSTTVGLFWSKLGTDFWTVCAIFGCAKRMVFVRLGLEELHSLVEQAETKGFPQTTLLDKLRAVAVEANKVAVVAQQLLNGKRQTRYPFCLPVWF